MTGLQNLMQQILANGKVEGHELATLKQELYGDGPLDRRKAELLVELHKRVQRVTPAFEQFFYQALKDHLLTDGAVRAGEATWLRGALFDGNTVTEQEKKFLCQLRGEARSASPEFQALCDEYLG